MHGCCSLIVQLRKWHGGPFVCEVALENGGSGFLRRRRVVRRLRKHRGWIKSWISRYGFGSEIHDFPSTRTLSYAIDPKDGILEPGFFGQYIWWSRLMDGYPRLQPRGSRTTGSACFIGRMRSKTTSNNILTLLLCAIRKEIATLRFGQLQIVNRNP